jgi:predicted nucleic acid-binding protein
MKVLFDTNVILDALMKRAPFFETASQLMAQAERHDIEGVLGATTVTTLYYLLAKHLGKVAAEHHVQLLMHLFSVAPVNTSVIEMALAAKAHDFEDAVLFCAAAHIHCDAIVTRNIKDFKGSAVPVYQPDELLTILLNRSSM